jgi:hypothetical protein
MASHWSSPGPADGFSPTWPSFWTFAPITAALAIVAVILAVLSARQEVPRVFTALMASLAGFTALAWVVPAWASADAVTPAEARLGARMLLILLAVASGTAVYLLLPPTVPTVSDGAERPTLSLAPGERVSWTGLTGSRVLEAVTALVGVLFLAAVVVAVVLHESAAWTPVVIFGLATLSALALAPARLTVDRRGIRLVSALLRIPLIRVKLENIDSVAATTIEPMQWGGWGFRVSGAGLAYVARRGPGLVIGRRGGGAVAITIDGPEQPAAVANALISRLPQREAGAR